MAHTDGLDDSLMEVFLFETNTFIQGIENALMRVERGEQAIGDEVPELFRAMHTIKSSAAMMGFSGISATAHQAEELLSYVRDDARGVDAQALVELVYACVDGIKRGLTDPERVDEKGLAEQVGEFLRRLQAGPTQAALPAQAEEGERAPAQGAKQDQGAAILPVAIGRLDDIVELAGELTTADMRLHHALEEGDPDRLRDEAGEMSKLIAQMQLATLSIRMVSLSNTFHKLKRMARDTAKELGKELELGIVGEETELDKAVVDALMPALSHLMRNAIDHGIEKPDDRERAGKPRAGAITLSASANGKYAVISVSDDGRGLDLDKIAGRALAQGLITQQQRADMTDAEIGALVFLPGFTTRDQVTQISGRGVGLDVVSEVVKGLMGSASLTATGRGATFTLRLPLTLSVMDALLLNSGGEMAILPLGDVKQIFDPAEGEIVSVNGGDSVVYRQTCYRIATLAQFLGRPAPRDYAGGVMILLKSEAEPYVLYADAVADHRSVVVKPVPSLLSGVPGIAGCSVMGTGRMALIIDVRGFYNRVVKGG